MSSGHPKEDLADRPEAPSLGHPGADEVFRDLQARREPAPMRILDEQAATLERVRAAVDGDQQSYTAHIVRQPPAGQPEAPKGQGVTAIADQYRDNPHRRDDRRCDCLLCLAAEGNAARLSPEGERLAAANAQIAELGEECDAYQMQRDAANARAGELTEKGYRAARLLIEANARIEELEAENMEKAQSANARIAVLEQMYEITRGQRNAANARADAAEAIAKTHARDLTATQEDWAREKARADAVERNYESAKAKIAELEADNKRVRNLARQAQEDYRGQYRCTVAANARADAAERAEKEAVAALDANWVTHQRVAAAEARADAAERFVDQLAARVTELERWWESA